MTRNALSTLSRTAALLAAACLAAGCSLQPRPTDELSQARMWVTQAVSAAAPDAQRAQHKIALAQRWVDAKDYGPARWLAEQAEVDAELALARAASRDAQRALARRELARASSPRLPILAEKSK